MHGYLDYSTVAIFALAPIVLGLTGVAAGLSYLLAVVHAAMTLVTDMPMSVAKFVPFAWHGYVEWVVGPVLVILSFVSAVAPDQTSMSFFLVMGAVISAVGLLTRYSPDMPLA